MLWKKHPSIQVLLSGAHSLSGVAREAALSGQEARIHPGQFSSPQHSWTTTTSPTTVKCGSSHMCTWTSFRNSLIFYVCLLLRNEWTWICPERIRVIILPPPPPCFAIGLDLAETGNFPGPCFCGHAGAIKTQKKRTTTAFLLLVFQFDNYSACNLLS